MNKLFKTFIVIISLLFIVGCDSGATSSNNSNTESKTRNQKTYNINEDIFVTQSDGGEYRFKITGIKESKERNEFSDTKADRVFIVDYEYENKTSNDDLYISSLNFKAYDKDNNSVETYEVIDYKYPTNISTGRKTTAQMVYALNNESNYLELEYYDNIFNSKSNCKIVLEW